MFVCLLVQIAYGRFSPDVKGYRDLDLFIQQKDGKKFVDLDKQSALCLHLKVEMLHPLRVIIANRGPDTELLVANPVELSGKGRPRVFFDVTIALKTLGICIFSVSNNLKVIQKCTQKFQTLEVKNTLVGYDGIRCHAMHSDFDQGLNRKSCVNHQLKLTQCKSWLILHY